MRAAGYGRDAMVTLVEEPVDVAAVFRGGKLRPTAFLWRGRRYPVRRVLGTYRDLKGRYLELYYSVMSDTPEVYELRFSTDGMRWSLVRVHSEG
ncbi:MAG: DUF6504 family protein [Actinomycetota bacterium]